MNRIKVETVVGLFVLVGLVSFAFLAVKLGGIGDARGSHYTLTARFLSASGLRNGAEVEMAGVVVGKVTDIHFNHEDFEAEVELSLPNSIRLQDDAIASIASSGLLGGKLIKISAGGSEDYLEPGDIITETESSVSLEELLSKYIFEGQSTNDK
jgi:phospholipid/cholesterol/gamma-HCH transport system substrate-binding protein